jgi:hypothetical protein
MTQRNPCRGEPQITLRLITRTVIEPIRSAITVTGIDGVTRNNSLTSGSTGVNDVATAGREYRGGRSEPNARSTVTREIPNRRAISRLLTPSLRCRALISAQSSKVITTQSLRWPTFRMPLPAYFSMIVDNLATVEN